jgi:formiminoglutamase
MSLQLMFDPVLEEDSQDFEHFSYMNQRIKKNQDSFPSLEEIDIAVIGITEDRGNPENEGAMAGADAIRRALYGLRASHVKYRIADLGNLRSGETLEDTYQRLKEVVRTLLEKDIVPILIGGTQDVSLAIVRTYEELEKKMVFLNIDSRSDTEPNASLGMSQHHISRILTRHKDILSRYIHLGYQTYLVDENILAAIDQHHYFKIRLGEVRENFRAVEPIVRSADFLSFDLSAIRMSEAPANPRAFPYGLSGEEACQICWYAGCSSKMKVFSISELNPDLDYREISASTVATMIWYFIEGFYNRNDELSFSPAETTKVSVVLPHLSEYPIDFYKGNVSGKWWMKINSETAKDGYEMIPCSEEDYRLASAGELPGRWINQLFNLS